MRRIFFAILAFLGLAAFVGLGSAMDGGGRALAVVGCVLFFVLLHTFGEPPSGGVEDDG